MLRPAAPFIVALDVGTSSVRSSLFDAEGRQQEGFGTQLSYQIATTADGGVEVDPALLQRLCEECLTAIHAQMEKSGTKPAAVAFCTFWHSFLGVDKAGNPVTPIVHLFDTRSTKQVEELTLRLDARRVHARTGCRLHTSYWPAKLLWLQSERGQAFAAADRWMSFGEYLFLRLFGKATASTSMVSGSGLWNQARNDYEQEVLAVLPIRRKQLCQPEEMDQPQSALLPEYRARWPMLDGIPWYPALGDGACNNIGSGCATVHEFSLMVGTSGAMRAVIESDSVAVPDGLWCYRVDRRRFVLGGAISNGGEVYAWMRRTLALPPEAETEKLLEASRPDSHGLVLLPFFAGERSPYWRADLRAAITGLNLATKPIDILQAALEAVALRFREIFELMTKSLGAPESVIGSGGALLASRAWTQMMADALGHAIVPCLEREATSRGAALLASERLGAIASLSDAPPYVGEPRIADPGNSSIYQNVLARQRDLFQKLFA
jgi:gluconokinase